MPSKDTPLGIEFPGLTYNEEGEPNWVGCLVAHYHSMLVYDYAVGGHTVYGVTSQVQQRFLPSVGQRPDWAPWESGNSLFGEPIPKDYCPRPRLHKIYSHMGWHKRLRVSVHGM